jgi:hypothetical protein
MPEEKLHLPSASLTSQTDSITSTTECKPNWNLLFVQLVQNQIPGDKYSREGSRQEIWYLVWQPFPSQDLLSIEYIYQNIK